MLDRNQLIRLCGLVVVLSLATTAWADTMTGVSSKANQGSNDSVLWSQLGANGTVLAASVKATSGTGVAVNVAFAGANSLASAVCAASPSCSWSGTGFAAGDRIIWTADAAAVTFAPSVVGTRSASLSVTDSAAGSPQLIPLNGVGTTAKLAPTSLNFGSVTVGTTSAAKIITLTNIGTTALTITGIAISGTGAGDYLQTHTCGASLAAGAS